ncbi:MAG: response regulator [Myxococcales bacterium]|jgi:PAS domain S-box-containing protein
MTASIDRGEATAALRATAERRVREERAARAADTMDPLELAHELHVHQVELEMQHDELRRIADELEQSRDRYRILHDLAPVGHVTLEGRGTVAECNAAAARLLRADRRALRGRPLSAFMSEADADALHRHRQAVLASGRRQTCELSLGRGPDRVPVRVFSMPVDHLPGCEPPCTLSVLIDQSELRDARRALVDERHRAEREQHESAEKLRLLAEHVDEVLYVRKGSAGPFEYVSPGFERLCLRPVAQLRRDPESLRASIHPDDRGRVERALRNLDRGDPFDEQYRLCRSDGEVRFVREQASFTDDGGDPARLVIGVMRDVTEERRFEEEVQHAQKVETIGALAGGIAHDFNNLLQAILGCAHLALDPETTPDEARHFMQRAAEAAKRGAGLTAQLMTLSRREGANARPVDLDGSVEATARLIERLLGESIELRLRTGCDGLAVMADPVQLEQVLLNLATNARDAMDGEGILSISTEAATLHEAGRDGADAAEVPGVRIHVRDTGCGMDEATRQRIFEPFFTTKEAGQGTGLGLASCSAIVRRLGGRIDVDSTPGRGSHFTVELPQCTWQPQPAAEPGAGELVFDGTALLVEDEPLVRVTLSHHLAELGLNVLEAAGPDQALRLAARHHGPIDVLVSDVMMPVMSGPRLRHQLAETHPDLPAVFMSAYAQGELVAMGAVPTGTPVLQKPFDREVLRERLCTLLPSRRVTRPRRRTPGGGLAAGPATILLVEDNATARAALQALLGEEGHRVLAAESAEQALTLLEDARDGPDLLLTDVSLPGISGTQLAARLAEDHPAARVIFMSGQAEPPASGPPALQKPIDLAELMRVVDEQLSG